MDSVVYRKVVLSYTCFWNIYIRLFYYIFSFVWWNLWHEAWLRLLSPNNAMPIIQLFAMPSGALFTAVSVCLDLWLRSKYKSHRQKHDWKHFLELHQYRLFSYMFKIWSLVFPFKPISAHCCIPYRNQWSLKEMTGF